MIYNSLKKMSHQTLSEQSNSDSPFQNVKLAPPDAIFGVAVKFNASTLSQKSLASVGVYQTDEGKPYVFPSVSIAEDRIVHKFPKSYLPITGYAPFVKHAREILWGDLLDSIGSKIASVQTLAGTGALSLAASFAKKWLSTPKVLLSNPTWPNYKQIFETVGHEISLYKWGKNGNLDVQDSKKDLEEQPTGSLVVLQVCAHNPTGIDPKKEEWNQLFESIEKKKHVVLFDFAYMGFASGDFEEDSSIVREYARRERNFFVCFSFSKIMGLYSERIGCLHVVCGNESESKDVISQLSAIVRSTYSNPPQIGALIATEILSDNDLKQQWLNELKKVTQRLISIRDKFCQLLEEKTGQSWGYFRKQRGMFSLLGLSPEEVEILGEKEGVFIPSSGRISIPSLNNSNVEFISQAIANVIKLRK
jgi:aspartate/tyrosine/aromatic aminotransferase